MLLSYSFSNFQSFIGKAEVSFVLTERDTASGWFHRTASDRKVSTVMAVMGANGAGKTSLLRVWNFLSGFISDSFNLKPEENIGFIPYMSRRESPSHFEVVYEGSDGTEWVYKLTVLNGRVSEESLYCKSNEYGARPNRMFERKATLDGYSVIQNFGIADTEAAKVRPNVSFISWAKQYGSALAQEIASINLITNVDSWGRKKSDETFIEAAEFYENHEAHRDRMRKLMKHWDFGLSDIFIEKISGSITSTGSAKNMYFPVGVHKHADGPFSLPFWMESSGTQTAFILLSKLLPILSTGGIALMDEFEADLHPHMIEPFLRLFHDAETNPHSAQLIFTCHSPEILRSLHRAQVTFVEKVDCVSEAYRGDAIEGVNSQTNLYTKYLSGALGAVPQV